MLGGLLAAGGTAINKKKGLLLLRIKGMKKIGRLGRIKRLRRIRRIKRIKWVRYYSTYIERRPAILVCIH